MDFIRVGSIAEIPEGEIRAFDLPAGRVAVVHVEARLFAFADECTHAGCALSEGSSTTESRPRVECNGSVFDVETGERSKDSTGSVAVHQARWWKVSRVASQTVQGPCSDWLPSGGAG